MARTTHIHPGDLHGLALLAADATGAVTGIVEAMHEAIANPPVLRRSPLSGRAGGIAGFVYAGVRGTAAMIGTGLDAVARPLIPRLAQPASTPQRDTAISILNGVCGDHLAATQNPLALTMELRRGGRALVLEREALARALPRRSSRVVVFVHGLCGTDGQWKGREIDYAAALERDFGLTPLFLRYNTGLHISTNGRMLAALLDRLVREWPGGVRELVLVGHSMGGLVVRSGFRHAGDWTALVGRMAFLGSPHHGAPLERGGMWLQELVGSAPFAAPLARLGRLRSAGITDLRHGNLLDEDWRHEDRFAHRRDRRTPLPLPQGVDCLAVAATIGHQRRDARDRLAGDGLVAIDSAHGVHRDPLRDLGLDPARRVVVQPLHHMRLLGSASVYAHLATWLGA